MGDRRRQKKKECGQSKQKKKLLRTHMRHGGTSTVPHCDALMSGTSWYRGSASVGSASGVAHWPYSVLCATRSSKSLAPVRYAGGQLALGAYYTAYYQRPKYQVSTPLHSAPFRLPPRMRREREQVARSPCLVAPSWWRPLAKVHM